MHGDVYLHNTLMADTPAAAGEAPDTASASASAATASGETCAATASASASGEEVGRVLLSDLGAATAYDRSDDEGKLIERIEVGSV